MRVGRLKERVKPVLYTPENLMANIMMMRRLCSRKTVEIAIVIDESLAAQP